MNFFQPLHTCCSANISSTRRVCICSSNSVTQEGCAAARGAVREAGEEEDDEDETSEDKTDLEDVSAAAADESGSREVSAAARAARCPPPFSSQCSDEQIKLRLFPVPVGLSNTPTPPDNARKGKRDIRLQ